MSYDGYAYTGICLKRQIKIIPIEESINDLSSFSVLSVLSSLSLDSFGFLASGSLGLGAPFLFLLGS